jgi:glutamate dehydrogenase
MITADPKKRAQRLKELTAVLLKRTPPEDRDLLLAFVPVVFAETPDRIALDMRPEILAERIRNHFHFVARKIPPSIQLYRGVPGIHVSVRNPNEEEATATATGAGLPLQTTVVETHTVDAPFIFDSLKNYFIKSGLRVFSAIHPIFTVRRQWERVVWIGGPSEDGNKEVYCHFQIEMVDSQERLRRMEHEIFAVLKSVFLAVEDFREMARTVSESALRLRSRRGGEEEVAAARAFVNWLVDENYIFFGTAQYKPGTDGKCEQVPESVSGVFRDAALLPVVFPDLMEEVESRVVPGPDDDRIVGLDFCKNATAIYHLDPIDYIVFREWGTEGSFTGATLLLGRFARGTHMQRANRIPLLQEKSDWIVKESGALPNSHIFREMRATFNRLPMRELFYAPPASLKAIIEPVVFMTGDEELAVHCRRGVGYVSLSISFSRLKYSYDAEMRLSQALSDAFGPVIFHTHADLGAVSLLLFYFDSAQLEHEVDGDSVRKIAAPLVTTWEARVAAALEAEFGEREGRRLFRRYVRLESRSGLYREVTVPEQTPADVRRLEHLEARLEARLVMKTAESATLNIYALKTLGLTNTLRTLQNLGLSVTEELRIPLALPEGRKGFIYRFEVEAAPAIISSLIGDQDHFIDAIRAVDEERGTDDPLNALILLVGMTWRQVELLRTLRNHLLQIRTHYNAETVNKVLLNNSGVASALYGSFATRFDPAQTGDRNAAVARGDREVQTALESVSSLAEDEVLRALDNLIRASVRTNFYQQPERPVFSIKIESRKVEGMPSPRPLFEIYVHSRLLEGIHLRGGRVARGGIRWSDRHDDFRTEILGLMKTQMVKNSIIVPVGSKGGFVLKGNVPARPALDAYLIDRYREFVSGLLDVTDNIVDGRILHPPDVVRLDADDPYLVVAADKGTAHLSDTANSVSTQYGFWLGDAFASGGSVGYDHKQVGITARGTWECIKHHFRNLGVDVRKEPFTVCGVGDMAGDVFGNGMLLSRTTRLVAAFNHRHIFIDPAPDVEKSFRERERLFKLPRSNWSDYNRALISKGGGVFDRSAKAIPVTPEMRRLLDIEGECISGEEMIRRILMARVDLLYNGGIGTYVKASSEDDSAVGDRANDRVRVDGKDLRARVVAEGGNLGLTQKGRLEFWFCGGLLNTDALDNSAGVDMSDHEVNIKILLDMLVKKGVIRNKDERNRILAEMTEEVAELVLADNQNQSLALTLDEKRSAARYEEFVNLVEEMVASGIINRVDEDVPTKEELLASPKRERGLPRPLLAKLLGYCKMWAFDQVMRTDLPDSPLAQPFLEEYFPRRLRESFGKHLQEHTLRREIIATAVVNHLINNGGISLLSKLLAADKTSIGSVVAAYLEVERSAGARALREEILGAGLDAPLEEEMLLQIEEALPASTRDKLQGKNRLEAPKIMKEIRGQLKK